MTRRNKKHPLIKQEEKSIQIVMAYERSQGRSPKDVSKQHIGYDIKSSGRFIEVKSKPGNALPPFINLHNALLRKLGKGISHYHIYLIWSMTKRPNLTIIPPDIIFRNLETRVVLHIPKKVFNKLPSTSMTKKKSTRFKNSNRKK